MDSIHDRDSQRRNAIFGPTFCGAVFKRQATMPRITSNTQYDLMLTYVVFTATNGHFRNLPSMPAPGILS